MSAKQEILDLSAQSKTRRAIAVLLEVTKLLDEEIYQEVVLQSGKYEQYKKDARSGTQDVESLELKLGRINSALIEIVAKLPPGKIAGVEKVLKGNGPQKAFSWKKVRVVVLVVAVLTATGSGGIFLTRFHPVEKQDVPILFRDSSESTINPPNELVSPDPKPKPMIKEKTAESANKVTEEKQIYTAPKKEAAIAFFSEEDPYGLLQFVGGYISDAFAQQNIITNTIGWLNPQETREIFEYGLSSDLKDIDKSKWIIICKYTHKQQKAFSETFDQDLVTDQQSLELKIFDAQQKRLIQTIPIRDIKAVKSLPGDDLQKVKNENKTNLSEAIKRQKFNLK